MTRKLVSLLVCLALVLALPCALAEDTSITVTDMKDRVITLDGPATRIVALDAADCEILCALGAEDTLVGRGEYCDYPESVLGLPSVNSGAELNIEEVVALEPQIVILSTMAQTVEQNAALEKAGIQVVAMESVGIEGVYESIALAGAITGKNDEAAALTERMKVQFSAISDVAQNSGKTVYFEVSPLQYGLWTAGAGTFMDEIAGICGLTNAFADVEGWAEISEEQVIERDPDYIVTISMYYGEGPTPVEEIMSRAGWDGLKAVKSSAIFNADSNEISRPGPRLADAASKLYAFISAADHQ